MDEKTVRKALDNQATDKEAKQVAEWLATEAGSCFLDKEIMHDLKEEYKKSEI